MNIMAIRQINVACGRYPPDPSAEFNIFKSLAEQIPIVREEVLELRAAIRAQSVYDAIDAAADVLFTAFGGVFIYDEADFSRYVAKADAVAAKKLYSSLEADWKLYPPTVEDWFILDHSLWLLSEQQERQGASALHYSQHPPLGDEIDDANDLKREALGVFGDLINSAVTVATWLKQDWRQNLQTVIDSNLSKFDRTKEDAEATALKYRLMGVPTVTEEVYIRSLGLDPVYMTKVSHTVMVGDKKYIGNKWLKSHRWREPVFTHRDVFIPKIDLVAVPRQ